MHVACRSPFAVPDVRVGSPKLQSKKFLQEKGPEAQFFGHNESKLTVGSLDRSKEQDPHSLVLASQLLQTFQYSFYFFNDSTPSLLRNWREKLSFRPPDPAA